MIDFHKLRTAASDPAVSALLTHLSSRTNDARVTTADSVQALKKADGNGITRGEAVRALQALADAGCGNFFVGRRDHKTRLEWVVSAIEAANYSGNEGILPNSTSPKEDSVLKSSGTFEFRFPLRRGYDVSIVLPGDFKADERHRLATAISALPVE